MIRAELVILVACGTCVFLWSTRALVTMFHPSAMFVAALLETFGIIPLTLLCHRLKKDNSQLQLNLSDLKNEISQLQSDLDRAGYRISKLQKRL